MDFTSRKIRARQWIAGLTICAILLTNFLSSVVILNPSVYQGTGNWLTGEKILICTSKGLQWLQVEELRRQSHHTADTHDANKHHEMKFHCPILKSHQPLSSFPADAIFFLLALISLSIKVPRLKHQDVTERIYFSYAPKQSPPL